MRKLVWLLATATALAACAGDDDSGGGGGGGDAGGSGSVPTYSGFVAISSYNAIANGSPIVGSSASVTFTSQTAATAYCANHPTAGCDVYVCPTTTPPTPTYLSDGTITITGAAQSVTLTPNADKTYTPFTSPQNLFSGGENVTFKGTGSDAPAFMLSITAPARASISSPGKPGSGGTLVINRAQEFAASWSGGGSGKVYLYVSGSGTTISCGFDASAGSGKVPAAALAMLSAGTGSFSASSLAVKFTDVGEWRIYGQAFFTGVWASDMSLASATATLQ